MKKKFKFGSFISFAMILSFLSACNSVVAENILENAIETNSIKWGILADTPLFGFMNIAERQIEGFEVDLATAITKEILGEDAIAEIVEVANKTRVPLIKSRNVDAVMATMTITEERLEVIDFSDVYFEAGQSLLVHKDSDISSVYDLTEDDVVLSVKGSTSVVNIRSAVPNITVLELESYSEAFLALKVGQGIAVTTDNSILYGFVAEDPNYVVLDEMFTSEPYGIAINKGQEDFLKAVNEALQTLTENGTYEAIYDKWLGSLSE